MGSFHRIDEEKWPRAKIAEFFGTFEEPRFSMTLPIDVTKLYRYCEIHEISFYYSMVYLAMREINSIPEFHYKIRKDGVFYYDNLVPSFTDLKKGSTSFYICEIPLKENESLIEYAKRAKDFSDNSKDFINKASEDISDEECVFISCIPWMDITSTVEARKFDRNDSTPHMCWGRYLEENGKLTLHFEIQSNHRLVDGLHIGLFMMGLQKSIDELK
jgi:chloramphenicol O-acetyltransferase type A